MRQTSKAVLLLIASAQAAGQTNPGFSSVAGVITPTLANQGSWLGYSGTPIYRITAVGDMTPNVKTIVKANNTNKTAKNDVNTDYTTSCVSCVRGKTAGGERTVWCSAGWNYEYTALKRDKDYPTMVGAAAADATKTVEWNVLGDGDGAAALVKGDQGFCCYNMKEIHATAALLNNADTVLVTQHMNKWTCPAKWTWINDGAKKAKEYAGVTIATTNWWCSDGSYNLVGTDDTYATKGAAANWNEAKWATKVGDPLLTVGNLIKDADTQDKRTELFLQACRQKREICGNMRVLDTDTEANNKRVIVGDKTGAGFSSLEKCTWVLSSKTKAPTFVIGNTTAKKQLPSTVDVIYQEWVDGWQITAGTDFLSGFKDPATGTMTQQGGVPIAAMATANYAKAYKWNYNTKAELARSGIEDASTNNSQRGGEAWVYQSDAAGCTPGATGAADKPTADCFKNLTRKRWIELDVSGATYLNAIQDNYDGKLSTFNSDATSYNKYLADLKTANEKDAFSAFFSPPKKPAMVKRPGAPTKPSTYTGLQHWPAKSQTLQLKDGSGFPTTDGKQFVLGNNNLGGWGAWTISRLTGPLDAATNRISHSFGMLGTTQGTKADTGRSYAKQWQKANEKGDRTTDEIKKSFTGKANEGGLMCTTTKATTTTHACLLSKTGTEAAANTAYAYLNVSVWTNTPKTALTKTTWKDDGYDPYIQFYASAWADGKAYYAPAAAADGTALSEPAGAQALAASAAAALAVAAALY